MPVLPIDLTDGYVPVIQINDAVRVGQILASRPKITEFSVHIAEKLGIDPKKVGNHLLKNPGDTVHPGDEIAVRKNFWGKTGSAVVSTIDGIVTRFERHSGVMFIKPAGQTDGEESIISPIEGTISLCNNEKILIETDKHFVLGNRGSGDSATETVLFVHENSSDTVQSFELDASTIGNIVLGRYFPKELLIKSVSMGISGIIGTKFLSEDLAYLQNKRITLPVIEIAEDDLPKLKHWHGKRAYMHGEGKTVILLHN